MSKFLTALNQIEKEKSAQHVPLVSEGPRKKPSSSRLWKFVFLTLVISCLGTGAYFFGKYQFTHLKAQKTLAQPPSFFTIQLITYQTKSRASVQAQKLATQGYETFVVPKGVPGGTYFQLCLGKFANQNRAHEEWAKLKSILTDYKDMYVRFIHE